MKSWKASKEQPEILCWKAQDRAQSFAFRSYTMHELRNQNVSFVWFLG